MHTEQSETLYKKACTLMPGGVNSPVRAFRSVGRTPLFIRSAKGDKLLDEDGNEWIDYVCSWGPGILGHAHPVVVEKVRQAALDGLTFGAPTKKETELAELVRHCMPSMEKLRLVNSGTEAVMSAVRAARGYTGRDKIVKFRGCYHGHSDGLLVKAGSGALTGGVPDSGGVPASYTEHTLVASYNDRQSVEDIFRAYGEEIACLLVEPVAAATSNEPMYDGDTVHMTVEYRSDLNGGLDHGFWIREFGVFARDLDGEEVLLYYGTLGDYPQWVSAYSKNGIDTRRFPISITVGEGAVVVIDYSPEAFMTAEDVAQYCVVVMLPQFLAEAQKLIDAHHADAEAHPAIQNLSAALDSRLSLLELMYNTDVSGNPFTVTFESLTGLVATGVWNATQKRLEF